MAAYADNLEGIGLREYDGFRGRKMLSMMGGARLLIKADGGLSENAGMNEMQYESLNTGITGLASQLSRKCTRIALTCLLDHIGSNTERGKVVIYLLKT